MSDFAISEKEAAAVTDLLTQLAARAGRPLTLDGLISGWAEFVRQVERGYTDSIYDYLNDLAVRGLLKEIIEEGPEGLRRRVFEAITAWDERFRMATRLPKSPLTTGEIDWWLRVPRMLAGELRTDLLAGSARWTLTRRRMRTTPDWRTLMRAQWPPPTRHRRRSVHRD